MKQNDSIEGKHWEGLERYGSSKQLERESEEQESIEENNRGLMGSKKWF